MSNYASWLVSKDAKKIVWLWANDKFRFLSDDLAQIEDYLGKFLKPEDAIILRGFKDVEVCVKGKDFLKEYNVRIKKNHGNR